MMKAEDKTKKQLINELEDRIEKRTADLRAANEQLQKEIARRKRVEKALRKSEEQYRDLYENAPIAYNSVGIDARIRRVNRRSVELLGYKVDELVGRPVFDLYADTPDGKEKAQEIFVRFHAGEEIQSEELELRRADGTLVWVSLTVRPVLDANGQVVESRSMAVDITERKRTEEKLREIQTRLKLLNNISTGITSGMVVEQVIESTLNQVSSYFPYYRVAYATIDEQNNLRVMHSIEPSGMSHLEKTENNLSFAPEYLDVLRKREPIMVEDVARDVRLAPLVHMLSAVGVRALLDVPLHHSEQLVGLICFDSPEPRKWNEHEITTLKEVAEYLSITIKDAHVQQEREQAEIALRQSEEKLNSIIKSIPDIVYRLDSEGRITFISDSVKKYGYYPEELIGANVLQIVYPEDRKKAAYRISERRTGDRRTKSLEVRLLTKDQVAVPFEVKSKGIEIGSAFLIDSEGLYEGGVKPQNFIGTQGVARDISDRKRAVKALRESEERFRSIFENAVAGIEIVAPDTTFIRINSAFCKFLGYTESELMKLTVADITHPDDWQEVRRTFDEVNTGCFIDAKITEKRYIRKDGSIVWGYVSATWIRDSNSKPLYGLAVVQDITEQKRATERLEILHEIDQAILATQPLKAIAQTALDHIGRMAPFLRASIVVFDFEADQARMLAVRINNETKLGMEMRVSLEEFGIPDALSQGKVHMVEDIPSLSEPSPVDRILHDEGVRSYISVPLISQGELIGSLNLGSGAPGVFAPEHTDIAREVASQVAIAIRQARLSKEVQRYTAELDEQLQQLRYLYRLRSALEPLRSPDEVIRRAGEILMEALSPSTSGGVRIEYDGGTWPFGETDEIGQIRYERPISWGEKERGRLILYCGAELSESQERALLDETVGQIAGVLEARELEMQLLQSARLVSLGQMAAGVAHELNQPLAGISATAEDAYIRLETGLEIPQEELKEMTQDILGLVERMVETIGHLRVFSRDTSEEPDVRFSINEAVNSSLKLIEAQLRNYGILLRLDLGEDLPVISGHPHQMEQLLLNLLANARDALDEKSGKILSEGGSPEDWEGWIHIRTRCDTHDTQRVVVEVEDNGIGIDEADKERLFEPFFTTKDADRGTGLGLSISYAIVQNHEGQIVCESQKGEGTVFRVTLPAAKEGA